MRTILVGSCLVATFACRAPEGDLVVVFSVDTLGAGLASETGWCTHLQDLVGAYGLDAACLDPAIAPSSWTAESHTRVLWPENTSGPARANLYPECGQTSVLTAIQEGTGTPFYWGAENLVLSTSGKETCGVSGTAYSDGTDRFVDLHDDMYTLALMEDDDRPVSTVLDTVERRLAQHPTSGMTVFLNVMEPGGHVPRCWHDPFTPSCDALWDAMAAAGRTREGVDRQEAWLDPVFNASLLQLMSVERPGATSEWRPLTWQTLIDAVAWHREAHFEDHVRRLLDAAEGAGRLDDVRMVVFGDHGENPCVPRGLGDDTLNCGHNGLPTPYTAYVPVYTVPSAMGEEWVSSGIAGAGEPWSLVRVSYGLLDTVGVTRPPSWPEPEAVGTATSWTCQSPDQAASGIRVEGGVATRCAGGTCDGVTFEVPTDAWAEPAPATVSDALAALDGPPDWFSVACGVTDAG